MRVLDKWAVLVGGGVNHRIGLYDMVMIKNNHIAAAGGVQAAIRCCQVRLAPALGLPAFPVVWKRVPTGGQARPVVLKQARTRFPGRLACQSMHASRGCRHVLPACM